MSLIALGNILEEMRLDLSEPEITELDDEFNKKLGILGLDHCEKLQTAWEVNKSNVEDFIYNYIEKKCPKRAEVLICPLTKKKKKG